MKNKVIIKIAIFFVALILVSFISQLRDNEADNLYYHTGECTFGQSIRLKKDKAVAIDYRKIETIRNKQQQIKEIISQASSWGCMAFGHWFIINYDTSYEGVELNDITKSKFPNGISIYIQHQYRELKALENGISVVVYFNGSPDRIYIPYHSITSFEDPPKEFILRPWDDPTVSLGVDK